MEKWNRRPIQTIGYFILFTYNFPTNSITYPNFRLSKILLFIYTHLDFHINSPRLFRKFSTSTQVGNPSLAPMDCIEMAAAAEANFALFFGLVAGMRLCCPIFIQQAFSGGIQLYGRFVHKDELETVSEDLFFNPPSIFTASALPYLSCK